MKFIIRWVCIILVGILFGIYTPFVLTRIKAGDKAIEIINEHIAHWLSPVIDERLFNPLVFDIVIFSLLGLFISKILLNKTRIDNIKIILFGVITGISLFSILFFFRDIAIDPFMSLFFNLLDTPYPRHGEEGVKLFINIVVLIIFPFCIIAGLIIWWFFIHKCRSLINSNKLNKLA